MCCLVVFRLALVRVQVTVEDGMERGMCEQGMANVCYCVSYHFGSCYSHEVCCISMFDKGLACVVVAE